MKKLISILLGSILVLSIILSGCSTKNTEEVPSAGETTKKGGTVRMALWNSPSGVFAPALSNDAYNFYVNALMYEGLLKMNPNLEFEPCLAKSWDISPDNKTITFELRDDVKWHDGQPFTAEDVRATFEFIGHTDYAGVFGSYIKPIQGAEAYKNKQAQHIEGIKMIDPYTISITTDEVYAAGLLNYGSAIRIMAKHIWENVDVKTAVEDKELLRNPVGTGPFKISEFVPDQYVELAANDNYWNHRPNVDKVILQVINQETAQAQIINGEIDFMLISQLNKDDLDLYESNNIEVQQVPMNSYQFMGINNEMEIFKDKGVRQAFAYAINREAIVLDVLSGYGAVASNPYRSDFWAYPNGINEYKYNPQKAIELLKEAGWEYKENEKLMYNNGQPVKFVLKYPTGNKPRERAAAVIQQNLKEIGIQLELQIMEFSTLDAAVKKGDFELYLMAMGTSTGDPDITRFYHTDYMPLKGLNSSRYSNKELDKLLEQGQKLMTIEDRKPIYNEAAKILNEEMPIVYLYHWFEGRAINGNLKGVQCFPGYNYYNIENWYFEN